MNTRRAIAILFLSLPGLVSGGSTSVMIPPGGFAWMALAEGTPPQFTVEGEPLLSPGPWRGERARTVEILGPSCMEVLSGLSDDLREELILRLTDLLAVPIDAGRGALPGFADVDRDGYDDLVVTDSRGGIQVYLHPEWREMHRFSPPGELSGGSDLDSDGVEETVTVTGEGTLVLSSDGMPVDTLRGFSFGTPSGAALGDIGGDGLADIVLGMPDGRVLVCRNRGTSRSPLFLPWSSETRELFPMDPGTFASPTFLPGPEPVLLVGTGSAGLRAWTPVPAPGDPWPVAWREVEAPRVGPGLLNLTLAASDDVLMACERNGIVLTWGIETGEELESRIPRVPGTYPVIASGRVPFFEGPVLIAGTREGEFYILRSPESPAASWEPLPGLPSIPSGSPAFYGDGIVTGSGEGDIRYFVSDDSGNWTEIVENSPFIGLDVGEYSVPSFADIDGDGREELLIGNARGDLTCLTPASSIREGSEMFVEVYGWEFTPNSAVSDLESYYTRYYRECPALMTPADTASVRAFAAELTGAPAHLVDEMAHSIASTPTEVLREMCRNGDSDLFTLNAQAVYRMAEELAYAELTEADGMTFLSLETGSGSFTVEQEDYYRFVVNPRVLFEIPARVDASFWLEPYDSSGISEEEWLRHDPEDLYGESSAAESLFWRTALPRDTLYRRSLLESVADAVTVEDAVLRASNFQSHSQPGGIMDFGYQSNDLQPMVIYRKAYGSCGEQSILQTALCRALLIPSYVVGCRGEDHQWNEFLDPSTGRWTHWDINHGSPAISEIWVSGEGVDHGGKTISAITAFGPDDVTWSTTGSAMGLPGAGYMPGDSGYTETASVEILVTDRHGQPVGGAMVLARSHWDRRNMVCTVEWTDMSGLCSFDLGWEPYGGYTIDVISPFGAGGSSGISFEEGSEYSLTYSMAGTAPVTGRILTGEPASDIPSDAGPVVLDDLGLSFPLSYYTGQLYRLSSDEGGGYAGARWFPAEPVPVPEGPVYYMNGRNFRAFLSGGECRALRRSFRAADGDTCYAVLDNTGAMFHWRSVTLDLPGSSSPAPLSEDEANWLSGPLDPSPPCMPESICDGSVQEADETGEYVPRVFAVNGIELVQDDPDDPLSSSWILGPFKLPEDERSIIISTEGRSAGLDMDMYLFKDGNGNRLVDGLHEMLTSSTSPTASEDVFVPEPERDEVYWLYLQGWNVPDSAGILDLTMGFEPQLLSVEALSPVGPVSPEDEECSFRLTDAVGPPVFPRVLWDGAELPAVDSAGTWRFTRPSRNPSDGVLAVEAHDLTGRVLDRVEWDLLPDPAPPEILALQLDIDSAGMELALELTAFDAISDISSAELTLEEGEALVLGRTGDSLWTGTLDLLPFADSVFTVVCLVTDRAGNTVSSDPDQLTVPAQPEVMFGYTYPASITYDRTPLLQLAPVFRLENVNWTASAVLSSISRESIPLETACLDPYAVQFRPVEDLPDGMYTMMVDILDGAGGILGTSTWEFEVATMGETE